MLTDHTVALIIGHPGHELRVYRFLEVYKPRVYILTDGSGSTGKSRLERSLKIIKATGCSLGAVAGAFSDKDLYDMLCTGDITPLFDTMNTIIADMKEHGITALTGDCIEGYNPTHDLCRHMINSMAVMYQNGLEKPVPNYEFYLDGPPHLCPEGKEDSALWLQLSEQDFERKYAAAHHYPEIFADLENLIEQHGKAPFSTECLWPVQDYQEFKKWKGEEPYYERYGKAKVNAGVYREAITFKQHMQPIAEQLLAFSQLHG